MPAAWSPLKTVAQSTSKGWVLELDPTQPQNPLKFVSAKGIKWQALAIQPLPQHTLRLDEVYVRQQDLIARFGQGPQDQYSFQVDYRLVDVPSAFDLGLEIWISVQTSLLDTAPKLALTSVGTGTWSCWKHQELIGDTDCVHDEADSGWSGSQANARAAVVNTTGECSFVWLVEPRDQVQLQWTGPTNESKQTAELFGSFLEKGVIRRARLQLLVSQQKVGLAEIQTAYTQLRHRELPLTT